MELEVNGKKIWVKEDSNYFPYYHKVESGLWEPDTFQIFDTFLDQDHSYFDIGAWIGITALYGALNAKHCYAFEPDPIAYKRLQENIDLNPLLKNKITVSPKAISDKTGESVLGSVTSDIGGDSNSSLLFKKGKISWNVLTTTLDEYAIENGIHDFNFIKMDIEGGEGVVLPSMNNFLQTYKPTLFLAIHPVFYGPDYFKITQELIKTLSCYKHLFISHGEEIEASAIGRIRALYEIVATDLPIKAFKDTAWSRKVKALSG